MARSNKLCKQLKWVCGIIQIENVLTRLEKDYTKTKRQHIHSFFSNQVLIKDSLHDPPNNFMKVDIEDMKVDIEDMKVDIED